MAKKKKSLDHENPGWPSVERYGDNPITELSSLVAGGLSPFGETTFPLKKVPYVHPHTVINR